MSQKPPAPKNTSHNQEQSLTHFGQFVCMVGEKVDPFQFFFIRHQETEQHKTLKLFPDMEATKTNG